MAITLNRDGACGYLQGCRLDSMDGIALAVRTRMDELGVPSNKRAHHKCERKGARDGNMSGILRYVKETELTGDEETDKAFKQNLQMLDAVITGRYNAAGAKVPEPPAKDAKPETE